MTRRSDLWLYCEKCESSYRPWYWCSCWDTDPEDFGVKTDSSQSDERGKRA